MPDTTSRRAPDILLLLLLLRLGVLSGPNRTGRRIDTAAVAVVVVLVVVTYEVGQQFAWSLHVPPRRCGKAEGEWTTGAGPSQSERSAWEAVWRERMSGIHTDRERRASQYGETKCLERPQALHVFASPRTASRSGRFLR